MKNSEIFLPELQNFQIYLVFTGCKSVEKWGKEQVCLKGSNPGFPNMDYLIDLHKFLPLLYFQFNVMV